MSRFLILLLLATAINFVDASGEPEEDEPECPLCATQMHAMNACIIKACPELTTEKGFDWLSCALENCPSVTEDYETCTSTNCPAEVVPCEDAAVDTFDCASYGSEKCDWYVSDTSRFVFQMCPSMCGKCDDTCSQHCQIKNDALSTCISNAGCDSDSDLTCLSQHCLVEALAKEECAMMYCQAVDDVEQPCEAIGPVMNCVYGSTDDGGSGCYDDFPNNESEMETCAETKCLIQMLGLMSCYNSISKGGAVLPNFMCGSPWSWVEINHDDYELPDGQLMTPQNCAQACNKNTDKYYNGATVYDERCFCTDSCDCMAPLYGALTYFDPGEDDFANPDVCEEAACCDNMYVPVNSCFYVNCQDVLGYPLMETLAARECMMQNCEDKVDDYETCTKAVSCKNNDGSYACGSSFVKGMECDLTVGTVTEIPVSGILASKEEECLQACSVVGLLTDLCCFYDAANQECHTTTSVATKQSTNPDSGAMICIKHACPNCANEVSAASVCGGMQDPMCNMNLESCYYENCHDEWTAYTECADPDCHEYEELPASCSCTNVDNANLAACKAVSGCDAFEEMSDEQNWCVWGNCQSEASVVYGCKISDTCNDEAECPQCSVQQLAFVECYWSADTNTACENADDVKACQLTECPYDDVQTCRSTNTCDYKTSDWQIEYSMKCGGSSAGETNHGAMDEYDCLDACNLATGGFFEAMEFKQDEYCYCLTDCPCLEDLEDSDYEIKVYLWEDKNECDCTCTEQHKADFDSCAMNSCYDPLQPDVAQTTSDEYITCVWENCWNTFTALNDCFKTECSWKDVLECETGNTCTDEINTMELCMDNGNCANTDYESLTNCFQTEKCQNFLVATSIENKCDECQATIDQISWCSVQNSCGLEDIACLMTNCGTALTAGMMCEGENPDACMEDDLSDSYCPNCAQWDTQAMGCYIACGMAGLGMDCIMENCMEVGKKKEECYVQNRCGYACYDKYDGTECQGASVSEVIFKYGDDCSSYDDADPSNSDGIYYKYKDNMYYEDEDCQNTHGSMFFDSNYWKADECYRSAAASESYMVKTCPDNVLCMDCVDDELETKVCAIDASVSCMGTDGQVDYACMMTTCGGAFSTYELCKVEHGCYGAGGDDGMPDCPHCSDTMETFFNCYSNAQQSCDDVPADQMESCLMATCADPGMEYQQCLHYGIPQGETEPCKEPWTMMVFCPECTSEYVDYENCRNSEDTLNQCANADNEDDCKSSVCFPFLAHYLACAYDGDNVDCPSGCTAECDAKALLTFQCVDEHSYEEFSTCYGESNLDNGIDDQTELETCLLNECGALYMDVTACWNSAGCEIEDPEKNEGDDDDHDHTDEGGDDEEMDCPVCDEAEMPFNNCYLTKSEDGTCDDVPVDMKETCIMVNCAEEGMEYQQCLHYEIPGGETEPCAQPWTMMVFCPECTSKYVDYVDCQHTEDTFNQCASAENMDDCKNSVCFPYLAHYLACAYDGDNVDCPTGCTQCDTKSYHLFGCLDDHTFEEGSLCYGLSNVDNPNDDETALEQCMIQMCGGLYQEATECWTTHGCPMEEPGSDDDHDGECVEPAGEYGAAIAEEQPNACALLKLFGCTIQLMQIPQLANELPPNTDLGTLTVADLCPCTCADSEDEEDEEDEECICKGHGELIPGASVSAEGVTGTCADLDAQYIVAETCEYGAYWVGTCCDDPKPSCLCGEDYEIKSDGIASEKMSCKLMTGEFSDFFESETACSAVFGTWEMQTVTCEEVELSLLMSPESCPHIGASYKMNCCEGYEMPTISCLCAGYGDLVAENIADEEMACYNAENENWDTYEDIEEADCTGTNREWSLRQTTCGEANTLMLMDPMYCNFIEESHRETCCEGEPAESCLCQGHGTLVPGNIADEEMGCYDAENDSWDTYDDYEESICSGANMEWKSEETTCVQANAVLILHEEHCDYVEASHRENCCAGPSCLCVGFGEVIPDNIAVEQGSCYDTVNKNFATYDGLEEDECVGADKSWELREENCGYFENLFQGYPEACVEITGNHRQRCCTEPTTYDCMHEDCVPKFIAEGGCDDLDVDEEINHTDYGVALECINNCELAAIDECDALAPVAKAIMKFVGMTLNAFNDFKAQIAQSIADLANVLVSAVKLTPMLSRRRLSEELSVEAEIAVASLDQVASMESNLVSDDFQSDLTTSVQDIDPTFASISVETEAVPVSEETDEESEETEEETPTCPASDTDSLEGNVTGAECMCSGTSCAVEVGSFCTVAGQCVAAEVEDDCGACSATCGDASRTCAKLCKVGDLEVEFEGNCDGSDAPTVEDCDLESCGDGIDAGAMEITMFLAVFLVGLLF